MSFGSYWSTAEGPQTDTEARSTPGTKIREEEESLVHRSLYQPVFATISKGNKLIVLKKQFHSLSEGPGFSVSKQTCKSLLLLLEYSDFKVNKRSYFWLKRGFSGFFSLMSLDFFVRFYKNEAVKVTSYEGAREADEAT